MSEALRLHLIKQFLVLCVPFATFNEHVQFADHFTFNLSKAIKRHYISVRIQSQGFQRKLVTGCQLLSVWVSHLLHHWQLLLENVIENPEKLILIRVLTDMKFPFAAYSHWIMSKKMGIVARRSS